LGKGCGGEHWKLETGVPGERGRKRKKSGIERGCISPSRPPNDTGGREYYDYLHVTNNVRVYELTFVISF